MKMKLINTNNVLKTTLSRLVNEYENISFAVAWASAGTKIFNEVIRKRKNIHKSVIGTHFYQTHPDVLDAFVDDQKIHFMLQPNGVFHPKIYLFWNENEWEALKWEALIGSADLTVGALTNNSEVMVLISGTDADSSMKENVLTLIEDYWNKSRMVRDDDARAYRAFWERNQSSLRRLSGKYGKLEISKSPIESNVMTMTWKEFICEVSLHEPEYGERCELLELVHKNFKDTPLFGDMEIGVRRTIAGLPNKYNNNWSWFGKMQRAHIFKIAIDDNNPNISSALDNIPISGPVTKGQYNAYLEEFSNATRFINGVATASRLLAMKRPDYFVCLDSKNKEGLCESFGIAQGINYNSYWEEIIERIMDSVWWNEPRPNNGEDWNVWDGRAAMLDAIFYERD